MKVLPVLALVVLVHIANGKLVMPRWFGDGMVLQTNAEYGKLIRECVML